MKIRDRIKEFRRIPADKLQPHPKNWRVHPEKQQNVLQGVLAEIGYADALLARELPDGSLQLIDGHLRAETTPHQDVPVLILDLNDEETDKLLTVFDPIAALASTDQNLLAELVQSVETTNESLRKFLDEMLASNEPAIPVDTALGKEITLPTLFQILIECESEEQQRELYEELTERSINVKILNL